jgi:AcrR family transcriptional regulator
VTDGSVGPRPAATAGGPRRVGRRPGTADTRGEILAAARAEFAANGYDGASVRGIARAAGVDPALVHHYFGSKEKVFVAALHLPFDPAETVPRIVGAGPEGVGERLVRFFLSLWEAPEGRERMLAVLRSAVTNDAASEMFRQFLTRELLGRVAARLEVPEPHLHASLAASQLVGLAFVRYVIRVEPMASADTETVVRYVAPTLQRYLTQP